MFQRKTVTDAMIELRALAFTVNTLPTEVPCPALITQYFSCNSYFCYFVSEEFLEIPSLNAETYNYFQKSFAGFS